MTVVSRYLCIVYNEALPLVHNPLPLQFPLGI